MTLQLPLLIASAVQLSIWGYEVDGKSWPGGIRADVVVKATAADGTPFTLMFTIHKDAEPQDLCIMLADSFEEAGFVAHEGPNATVRLYGPKGQRLTSLTFASDQWTPFYHRAPWVPELRNAARLNDEPRPKK